MQTDQHSYFKFTTKSRLDSSVNSLLGLLEGISADQKINDREVNFLSSWMNEHKISKSRHPYSEIFPVLEQTLSDGIVTAEEKEDLIWLCKNLKSNTFYDEVSADLQRLHGVIGGISSDGHVSVAEIKGLNQWIDRHDHLKGRWPYDEVESMIMAVLKDGAIDAHEHKTLLEFFSEFTAMHSDRTITSPVLNIGSSTVGVCAVCPEIVFPEKTFCFTGASSVYSRDRFKQEVSRLGGRSVESVTLKVDYLVIGSEGNPCWAYACYGRKVEKAVELRKNGRGLLIIHENDFHDAILDLS